MIKNNLIYGFNENGVIGYTKNAIGDMSVLVHEYAHTYFTRNHENIDMVAVEEVLTPSEKEKEFYTSARFQPIFTGLSETEPKETASQKDLQVAKDVYGIDSEEVKNLQKIADKAEGEYQDFKMKYDTELFGTAMGVTFKRIQDKLPTYESAEQMRKNLAKDVKKILGGGVYGYEILIDVLKSMCGKQQVKSVKSAKTITMEDIKKQAKKVCETGTEQDAFVQGAIWALEQAGIKVAENEKKVETKVEEKVETPKEKKPKKATAKKTTGKPKKATKKAKVTDKPKYEVGTIFEDDSIIIGYKNGKYQIVTKNDELVEMTEKEIDEA